MNSAATKLEFCDANTSVGRPMNVPAAHFGPTDFSAASLLKALDRAGIAQALVYHIMQRDGHPELGNQMLTAAIAGQPRLVPCWTILPTQCGEQGTLDEFFAGAKHAGVKAFRAFPEANRYLLRREVLGDMLDRLVAAHAPLLLSGGGPDYWENIYDLLAETPELTVILTSIGVWGADRFFRPLLDGYPNVYLETSDYILDGGIEAFVEKYGSDRLLYGSNYPEAYHGGMMLAIAHAEISAADKQAIAAGNLRRLLSGVSL